MKTIAMIPVKLNSERVKEKNLRTFFDGTPLVHFIQKALIGSRKIDEIYVYCSNERIQDYLLDGVKFLKRPEFLDANTANCNDIIREFIKVVDADYYCVSHATAPFTTPESLDRCVECVTNENEYDSAFLAVRHQAMFWQDGNPLNFDPNRFPRTQDLKPVYTETSGAYVFPRWVFEKYGRRVGINPAIIETDPMETLDIDTEYDMTLAQALYKYMDEHKR